MAPRVRMFCVGPGLVINGPVVHVYVIREKSLPRGNISSTHEKYLYYCFVPCTFKDSFEFSPPMDTSHSKFCCNWPSGFGK